MIIQKYRSYSNKITFFIIIKLSFQICLLELTPFQCNGCFLDTCFLIMHFFTVALFLEWDYVCVTVCVCERVRVSISACKCVCMRNCKEYNHPFVGEAKNSGWHKSRQKTRLFLSMHVNLLPLSHHSWVSQIMIELYVRHK